KSLVSVAVGAPVQISRRPKHQDEILTPVPAAQGLRPRSVVRCSVLVAMYLSSMTRPRLGKPKARRKTALNWWNEISKTRLNEPKRSPLIVVMQRLHEEGASNELARGAALTGGPQHTNSFFTRFPPGRAGLFDLSG